MSRSLPVPDVCANCGASIPPRSKACPDCGADERTGWREQSIYDGLDLPDDESERSAAKNPQVLIWKVVVAVVALTLIAMTLRGRLW